MAHSGLTRGPGPCALGMANHTRGKAFSRDVGWRFTGSRCRPDWSWLARRRRLNAGGEDETKFLEPLEELVARGATPAEELLAKYHGPWGGSVEPVFDEYAY